MESGIESSAAESPVSSQLLGRRECDAVQLQKMKQHVIAAAVDKVLAPAPSQTSAESPLRNHHHHPMCNSSDSEILQIVELSDLLQLADDDDDENKRKCCSGIPISCADNRVGDNNNSNSHGQLIDFKAEEKCDVTPENLKKSDLEGDSLLIDLRGSFSDGLAEMTQLCDTTTAACSAGDQLTLLDLDEPLPAPEKPQAFTISFGDEQRSEEQKQKYEKMFERFQNKRSHHRRGQSMSKVDLQLSKSASQDSQAPSPAMTSSGISSSSSSAARTGPSRLAKTPSSAKLPRKTFSEPSSKANEEQQQQLLDDDAKVKLRDKRNAAMREPSKRHSWSPRTTTTATSTPAVVAVVPEKSSARTETRSVPKTDPEPPPQHMTINGKFTAKSSVLARVLVDTRNSTRTVIEEAAISPVVQVQYQPPPEPMRQLPEAPPPFQCDAQPLVDDSRGMEGADEELSDAGTYTLDGDNYTEEQKEMMEIDNRQKERQLLSKWEDLMAAQREEEEEEEVRRQREDEVTFLKCKRTQVQRPTSFEPSLEIIDLELIPTSPKELKALESDLNDGYYENAPPPPTRSNGRNVLDISCTYEEPPQSKSAAAIKSKVSYLEKIKTKVKNLGGGGKCVAQKSVDPGELESPDIGTFTSVTTSGILSYKPCLEDRPAKFGRRNSLTKTNIQNTEYVQGRSRVLEVTPSPLDDEKIMNSITDSDKLNLLSSSENEEGTSSSALKSAVTKNDWIHEWAKSARKSTSEMSRSFTVGSHVDRLKEDPMSRSECFAQEPGQEEEYGDNLDRNSQKKQHLVKRGANMSEPHFVRGKGESDSPLAQLRYSVRRRYSGDKGPQDASTSSVAIATASKRPPMSPTKIPSPVHTISRARSMSHNRSHGGSTADLVTSPRETHDTAVYLQSTAAAILSLQSMHLNNSPSPSHPPSSPRRVPVSSPLHSLSPQRLGPEGSGYNIIEECQNKMDRIQQLHKRNLSLDGSERDRNRARSGKNNTVLGRVLRGDPQQQHTRHHSYEGAQGLRQFVHRGIDQTTGGYGERQQAAHVAKQHPPNLKGHGAPQSSPIRRSSSFSTKPGGMGLSNANGGGGHQRLARPAQAIKKSSSSTSFKKYHYEDEADIYINDDDDLDPGRMSNESEYSEYDTEAAVSAPITNTRCNKAFMMRVEQNKSKPGPVVQLAKPLGVVACPNTPEMSRRNQMLRQPLRDRQSMPRDSSLNRMKQDSPMNFSSAKKVLKEPPAKVQPKYLDISKYKPTTSGNFLKKDESKSYLVKGSAAAVVEGIKRSPSSASVTLTRTDPTRMSNRSVKSAGMRPNQKKEPPAAPKQTKEQELAMWRRRASYDPMKAALEGKKRQEEAKRQMLAQQQSKLPESSLVLRSQSFHSGATMLRQGELIDDESTADSHTRWTTESSDEDF